MQFQDTIHVLKVDVFLRLLLGISMRLRPPKIPQSSPASPWKTPSIPPLLQGSRKSKVGWELTKSGWQVWSPEIFKRLIFVVFKLIIPITRVLMHLFGDYRPIWLATSISVSSFWLVDTYFWSYFSWLAKSAAKITNRLGTRSHRSHLSGALLFYLD